MDYFDVLIRARFSFIDVALAMMAVYFAFDYAPTAFLSWSAIVFFVLSILALVRALH